MPSQSQPDDSLITSAHAVHIGASSLRKTLEDTCEATVIRLVDGSLLHVGIVADGMGGIEGGEYASRITAEAVLSTLEGASVEDFPRAIESALEEAHRQVIDQRVELGFSRMGTTATVVCITEDNRLYLGHVGDSRAYLVRGGAITQITRDHTWGAEQLRTGRMTPHEVAQHERSDALAYYVGRPRGIEVDFSIWLEGTTTDQQAVMNQGMALLPGDRLVLCSDGLIKQKPLQADHYVEDAEILQISTRMPPHDAAQALLNLALERETDDNVSVVIMSMRGDPVIVEPEAAEPTVDIAQAATLTGTNRMDTALTPILTPGILIRLGAVVVMIAILVGGALLLKDLDLDGKNSNVKQIRIEYISGLVTAEQDSKDLHLESGQDVAVSGHIAVTTGRNSSLIVQLPDDRASLFIGPSSSVWLDPDTLEFHAVVVTLVSGNMVVDITRFQDRLYPIYTPDGDIPRVSGNGAVIGLRRVRNPVNSELAATCLQGDCVLFTDAAAQMAECSEYSVINRQVNATRVITGEQWQSAVSDQLPGLENLCPAVPPLAFKIFTVNSPVRIYAPDSLVTFAWELENSVPVSIESRGRGAVPIPAADLERAQGTFSVPMSALGIGQHMFSLLARDPQTGELVSSRDAEIFIWPICRTEGDVLPVPQQEPATDALPVETPMSGSDVLVTGRDSETGWLWVVYNNIREGSAQGWVPGTAITCSGGITQALPYIPEGSGAQRYP